MPLPTMLRNAKTRVRERSMIGRLNSSKFRQPAQPASATAVTPDAEGEAIGVDAVVARIRPPLARPGEDVNVDIDQPWRDIESRDLDGLDRQRRVDLLAHRGDLAVVNGHVADRRRPGSWDR